MAFVLFLSESRASLNYYLRAIFTGTIHEQIGIMMPTAQENRIAESEGYLLILAFTYYFK